ncbi:hypothetical protein Bbelb_049200 [Branchiostoma belcheri]|nr:hypothetical protein Bbelb_049200 [Branchiostoma belcheri]
MKSYRPRPVGGVFGTCDDRQSIPTAKDLQLKNAERAVACAALRTAFQNMDPEKEVFLSSEQTMCGTDNAAPALRSKVHPAAVLMQYTLRPVRSQRVRLRYYIDRESSNGKNTHSCINTGMPADGV